MSSNLEISLPERKGSEGKKLQYRGKKLGFLSVLKLSLDLSPLTHGPALAVTLMVYMLSPTARAPTVSMEPWRR